MLSEEKSILELFTESHTIYTHSLSSLPEVRKGGMEKVNSLFDFEYIYTHMCYELLKRRRLFSSAHIMQY